MKVIVKDKDKKYFEKSIYEVYKIKEDSKGYPHFLIYKGSEWVWISAKHFKPQEN